jgi:hypothetical protein
VPCGLAEEETRLIGEVPCITGHAFVLSTVQTSRILDHLFHSHGWSKTKFVPRLIFGENYLCSPKVF